jgi:hypothetical protein
MSLIELWAPPERAKELENDLYVIFVEAVHLSQFLRRQRAMWSVRFPQRPVLLGRTEELHQRGQLMFDPASMKDEYGEDEEVDREVLKRQLVELVITPTLYKRGNLNGERFDVEYAAVPAWVIMYSQ